MTTTFIQTLLHHLGQEHLLVEPAECLAYSYDNSRHQSIPLAVALPTCSEQIQIIVKLCNEYQIGITPRGRGTGTCGGAVPFNRNLLVSLERMQTIINIDPANRLIEAQAGVLNASIQKIASEHHLFWAPDPSSSEFCSIGGNLACNAAGPRAVKYGTTRENTLGLHAITGSGDLIKTGTYTTKGAVGYDLTRLLIGSEGTLAIISEATLKLLPIAESKITFLSCYRDAHTATQAVTNMMAQPMMPCALEFMDAKSIEIIHKQNKKDLPDIPGNTQALLLVEVDGPSACMATACLQIESACHNQGLLAIHTAQNAQEVQKLWTVRKTLSQGMRSISPQKISEDVVVPVDAIPILIEYIEGLSQRFAIPIANFGHAGNGNIHVNLLIDETHPPHLQQIKPCLTALFDKVLQLRGTLSGEHGIGIEKREFMHKALDVNALKLMHAIKNQFDPKGILNAGKVLA